jgi:hypothetical protein
MFRIKSTALGFYLSWDVGEDPFFSAHDSFISAAEHVAFDVANCLANTLVGKTFVVEQFIDDHWKAISKHAVPGNHSNY